MDTAGTSRRAGEQPDPDSLRPRQRQVLELIKREVATRGYPPSVREIGHHLGLRSPATVHSHLTALERAGHIRRDPSKPRAIEVLGSGRERVPAAPSGRSELTRDVPLVGRIAAGTPILAEEHIEEVVPLPESLVGSGPLFMLEVRGDSMTDAGILDGDMVVVRSQPHAENGEIVACLVEAEEATVKRLEKRQDAVILHAENPAYEPMVFTSGVEILGKVVTVLRRLGDRRSRFSRELFR
ncbi:MAG: transcriptional repressor LexA [bacterium]|nr:transcriptional repressor LexA [bacterium]MDE0289524.1 transcriptional repressor LexA [bacterium]MDE0439551.1 transcriptional repressor LexA [bacterium]